MAPRARATIESNPAEYGYTGLLRGLLPRPGRNLARATPPPDLLELAPAALSETMRGLVLLAGLIASQRPEPAASDWRLIECVLRDLE
jgi:hypothetical protein